MNPTEHDGVVSGSKTTGQPDYGSVDIPSKPPSEMHYTERRAEILQLVQQAGHPRMLNQAELADRYGVSQQQISKDFSRLAAHVDEALGTRRALTSRAVFDRCVRGLLDEEEWRDAARTMKDFNEWIEDYKDIREIKERLSRIEERQGERR